MKNTLQFLILLITILSLVACGASGSGTNISVSDTGNIEGIATDSITGNVISGATVQIGTQAATTGTDGVYTISNLSVGNHTITATMSGYQNYTGDVTIQKGITIKHDIKMSAAGSLPANKTTAALTISLTGSLPASTSISGADFTLTLPANVTPAMANGAVATSAVALSGTFAGGTLSPQVIYTAATASTPGKIKVILANSVPAGVNQVGEVATIILQLANGAVPATSNFAVSGDSVFDATLYAPIAGMNVVVANVTLQ